MNPLQGLVKAGWAKPADAADMDAIIHALCRMVERGAVSQERLDLVIDMLAGDLAEGWVSEHRSAP